MKKLFITALFAILMGGFAITANAQDETKTDASTLTVAPKLDSKVNKNSLQANDYQKQIDDFQTAVNNFVNAYKEQSEQTAASKNKKPQDLVSLLDKAEKLRDSIEKNFAELSTTQKTTFKSAKKLLEDTKTKFLTK